MIRRWSNKGSKVSYPSHYVAILINRGTKVRYLCEEGRIYGGSAVSQLNREHYFPYSPDAFRIREVCSFIVLTQLLRCGNCAATSQYVEIWHHSAQLSPAHTIYLSGIFISNALTHSGSNSSPTTDTGRTIIHWGRSSVGLNHVFPSTVRPCPAL